MITKTKTKTKTRVRVPQRCFFCKEKADPTYEHPEVLWKFLSRRAKIKARAKTGICAKHQRKLSRAVKQARFLALLPYREFWSDVSCQVSDFRCQISDGRIWILSWSGEKKGPARVFLLRIVWRGRFSSPLPYSLKLSAHPSRLNPHHSTQHSALCTPY